MLKLEATLESVLIFINFSLFEPFHDAGIETNPLICSGFYMIGTSAIKGLNNVTKMFEISRAVTLKNSSNPKAILGPCQISMIKPVNKIS